LAQLLLADGVRIAGFLIVTPFQAARARSLIAARGMPAFTAAARRALGFQTKRSDSAPDPMADFYRAEKLEQISLPELSRKHAIPCLRVNSLNSERAIAFVRECRPTGTMYCGGGILGRAFLQASGGRVLNAHAGPLPQVRGMNALEWSLLLDLNPEVTIHFIDEGIDTGPVVERLPIPTAADDTIQTLRDRSVVVGVNGLRRNVEALARVLPTRATDSAAHRQVFVLAPALAEIATHRLREARRRPQESLA
jgi:methionyl-tRNA formyltransferase